MLSAEPTLKRVCARAHASDGTDEDAKYLGWLERLFAEHVSKENLTSGDVRRRVVGTMSAVRTLRSLEGDLFGPNVRSSKPELLARLSEQYRPRFEGAVDEWRVRLEREDGSEGADAFPNR